MKKPKLFSIVLTLETLFIASIIITFQIITPLVKPFFNQLKNINLEAKTIEEIQGVALSLKNFYFSILTAAILTFLIITITYSITKGVAWCKITKKPIKIRFIRNYLTLNLAWFAGFTLLSFITIRFTKKPLIILIILGIAFLYLTPIISYAFTKKQVKKEIKKALNIKMILPILLIITTAIIINKTNLILNLLPEILTSILSIIILAAIFAWSKIYLAQTLKHIK